MTQEQALAEAQRLFPDIKDYIRVSRERSIGCEHGHMNQYYIWDHSALSSEILGGSNLCWEQALDEARSKRDECYQAADEPFEDELISSLDKV